MRVLLFTTLLIVASSARPQSPYLGNPLLPSGADPWVISHDGYYYFMATTGTDLTIRKTKNMADLKTAESKTVWRRPASGPYSRDIWAPELHFLAGKWYIYFAAEGETNKTHRIWVLEGCPTDPLGCSWSMKGKVADASDRWAIDATVFEDGGKMYMLWSGWPGLTEGTQNIYIAELSNPWTISGARVRISTPSFNWEKIGDRPNENPKHLNVNEGPEALIRNGRIFVTYSASGCWTDSYSLGMLTAKEGSNLLDAKSWVKSPEPVFYGAPDVGVFAPGHNSFFRGEAGKDWIVYHANSGRGQGCGEGRSPRAQPFEWKADGTPDFGEPVRAITFLPRP